MRGGRGCGEGGGEGGEGNEETVEVGKVWIERMIERMSGSGALRGRREVLRRIS